MENYICINGKKAELTEEQMKALGIELPKTNLFEKNYREEYYFINPSGMVEPSIDMHWICDRLRHNAANYCTDKAIMEQRALHETLNRLLWRYSMEHDGDKIAENSHGAIKCSNGVCEAFHAHGASVGRIKFYDKEIANNAIKEIIEPFMKAHPDFKW